MSTPELICRDEQRRRKARKVLNGLDAIEVSEDQRTLTAYFFATPPDDLRPENVRITGGVRIPTVAVTAVRNCPANQGEQDACLQFQVEAPGDFSTYTLQLVQLDPQGNPTEMPLEGFDPRYARIRFGFKGNCPSDLDCRTPAVCPPSPREDPEINYLAKDYSSFRQLMLDRLTVVMPDWQERHVPDLGIALVELLAYVGDYLSYYQDAVATEAYLTTARKRISVRRHARLVDYLLHEGCNARAWVHVWTDDDLSLDPREVFFISADEDQALLARRMLGADDMRTILEERYEVFEPVDRTRPIALRSNENEISFHTWGNRQCCLPRGATAATLKDGAPGPRPTPEPPGYPQYEAKEEYKPNQEHKPKPEYEAKPDYGAKPEYDAIPEYKPKRGETRRKYESKREYEAKPAYEAKPPQESPAPPADGLTLEPGDVLLFEEIRGPQTGNPADADTTHRHFVRLTAVTRGFDEVEQQAVLEIAWAPEDALPFPLCLSAIAGPNCAHEEISVARGNIILVDHGRTIRDEYLGIVPRKMIAAACEGVACAGEISVTPGKFRPRFERGPLTFALPFDASLPASRTVSSRPNPRLTVPAAALTSIPPAPDGSGPLFRPEQLGSEWDDFIAELGSSHEIAHQYLRGRLSVQTRRGLAGAPAGDATLREQIGHLREEWIVQPDLFRSTKADRHAVLELDDEGHAYVRFGEGDVGRTPPAGTAFTVTYRIGGGPAGNVGAETISRIVFRQGALSGVELRPRNPLPAAGGIPRETLAEAKLCAPFAFRGQRLRAVTADDYAHLAGQHPKVQRAAAELQWTGSGYEALVAIDQRDRQEAEETVLKEIADGLDPYRRIGHGVRVVSARLVPLLIAMRVVALPNYLQGHVKAALLDVLSTRVLPDGRRGLFHPDNLSFGQPVCLSAVVAACQAVPGVQNVTVSKLQRLYEVPAGEIQQGELTIGPLEIAQLDNDPNFPEHGRLEITMGGGR